MKSKTLILSSENEKNKSGRGILTIYSEDGLLQCRLRLYNVEKLNKYCKLGVYHNNEVYSSNLLEKNGTYTSSLVGDFDINKDFYVAIINTELNNDVVVSGGTYAGHFVNDDSVFKNLEQAESKTNLINPIASKQDLSNCSNDCSQCANCVYKEYFYNHKSDEEIKLTTNIEETKDLTNNETKRNETENTSVINSIVQQFDYVIKNYPENNELNNLIPNGKFVEIKEENNSYSIGAIYEEDSLKYLCYAVKSKYNSPPPTELGEKYQWLPTDKLDPLTDGYYLVFQDAKDLKILDL